MFDEDFWANEPLVEETPLFSPMFFKFVLPMSLLLWAVLLVGGWKALH